jgi:hypothetical protein
MTYIGTIDGRTVSSTTRYIVFSHASYNVHSYTSLGAALNARTMLDTAVYVWCDEHDRFEQYDPDDPQFSRKRV